MILCDGLIPAAGRPLLFFCFPPWLGRRRDNTRSTFSQSDDATLQPSRPKWIQTARRVKCTAWPSTKLCFPTLPTSLRRLQFEKLVVLSSFPSLQPDSVSRRVGRLSYSSPLRALIGACPLLRTCLRFFQLVFVYKPVGRRDTRSTDTRKCRQVTNRVLFSSESRPQEVAKVRRKSKGALGRRRPRGGHGGGPRADYRARSVVVGQAGTREVLRVRGRRMKKKHENGGQGTRNQRNASLGWLPWHWKRRFVSETAAVDATAAGPARPHAHPAQERKHPSGMVSHLLACLFACFFSCTARAVERTMRICP